MGLLDRFKRSGHRPAGVCTHDGVLDCQIAYNVHGAYCVPNSSRHRSAPRRILRGDVYEPGTIDFIVANCGDGDIVHAGTYFGDFLPALSRGVAAGCQVWGFEPNRESFRCAEVTVLLNGLDNVNLINAGLSAEPGEAQLRVADDLGTPLGGKSQLADAPAGRDAGTVVPVELTTVDATVPGDRPVSVIQLDVEDHEQAALTGAMATIRRTKPLLLIEVRKGNTLLASDWWRDNILSLGYRQVAEMHRNIAFTVD